MGREILLKGDTINGKFLYEIETVSGTGASCVVYKARYCDDKKQSHLVQIKEFYPYNLEIYREKNSNNLICTDAEQFEFEKCRFINNAKKLASFNNDEITNSGTPFQVEIFETNNTAYSVVAYDAGDIYSEENLQTMELAKLLEIIKNLARAVELFHKNGYVHFDIKPENFLVDNTDHITLFDIDSVTSCDEIDNETIQNISHTKKWAAPEVRQAAEKGKNTNVSYTADIYSIGLILFEAIMCRDFIYPVETLPYSRNWDIENSIKAREEKQNRKVNINPKFYNIIKEIFEKTLDRNPSKRYNSAQELYDNLDKARDLLKEKPWIIPSDRTVTPQFTARKSELSKMNSILQKENTVFLHGFGGIGKSELALKYAEVYKDNFDTVVFCKYENSIKEALLNIRIANYENDSNAMTLRKFAELCDERTLIILDNFDVETDEDDYLDEFTNNYSCKKIITTRTDFSELYTQLNVESLGQDDAILLFEKESKWIPKTEEEKTLNEILKLIGYHTYFTVILAKKKEMFSLSIDELRKQTEEMLLKKFGKVTVAKDGKLTTDTIDAIAAKLFDFNSITQSQIQTLRNLYMLRWRTVSRNDYVEIAGFGMRDEEKIELIDALNDLTRLGWVLHNEKTDDFFLHPIMQELVKDDCIKNNYSAENIVEYYNSRIEELKKRRGSYDEIVYVSSYVIKEIIFLCDSLFTISPGSAYTAIEFIEKTECFTINSTYSKTRELFDISLFDKMVSRINEYCLTSASIEIRLRWVEFLKKDRYNDYLMYCILLHDKLGVSKESTTEIKEQYWEIVKGYMLMKDDLNKKGETDEFLSENDKELISYAEEIKDIFKEGDEAILSNFKKWKGYKRYRSKYVEFENENYQKYLQKVNTLQSVTKEIYAEIMLDASLTWDEQGELINVLIVNAINQTNHKIVYNDIAENNELTEDEKEDLLAPIFNASCELLKKNLSEHIEDKVDECGEVLISHSERIINRSQDIFYRGVCLGLILLGHYVKNSESFRTTLDIVYENLCIKYGIKYEDKLTPEWWEGIRVAFNKMNRLSVIYPFINKFINRILDENTEVDTFSFMQLLEELTGKVYEETKAGEYLEMQNQYKKRMNEISGVNYNIKD